jgi:dethiobiotin synthetase
VSKLRGGAWFITGTDTAVGKTTIAIGLLRAAHQRGLTTAGLKPVAAGVDANGQNADAAELQLAASINLDYANINPALLKQAIAPHIAAADEGVMLGVAKLAAQLGTGLEAGVDFTVVEGAGGWLVPLNETETMAELCVALDLPVILIVGMKLGCLNHALLTAASIRAAGLSLAGWVANDCEPRMQAHTANIETLRARLDAPLLGIVPNLQSTEDVAEHLDVGLLVDD